MKQSRYSEPDYAFGQLMLTLRTHMGLSQVNLAKLLRVSRRAVGNWELGSNYPATEHLTQFIVLGVELGAFATGHEEEDIRALWQAAHQRVLFDGHWLSDLLRSEQPPPPAAVSDEQASGAEYPRSAPSPELALWTIPYARNPHFTGRDELLDQLEQQLAPSAPGQPTTMRLAALTQAQVIKGLGGIGKTQIAVEYAYRARAQGRYTHTLWITAASEEALLMSFAALAEQLPGVAARGETESRKLVVAVIRWLEQCQEPWLLIVDNADDLPIAQPYLPVQGNGSVLLTTRASATGWLAPSLEVDAMGMLEGTELLLRRAQRFAGATDEEINEAVNLAEALAQFPLALDQAGAYLEETGCSVSDYLEFYRQHRRRLLARRGQQASGYPASVATTWSLSFERVTQVNPACAHLLQLCALLAPDHIPEDLLLQASEFWPAALQRATADRFGLTQLLEPLLAFSLIKRHPSEQALSIHRLVQAVQMDAMPPEEVRQWARRLVLALNRVFPQQPASAETWPQCQRYLDQVQVCDALVQQQELWLPEAADLLDRTGSYFLEHSMYSLAETLYRRAQAMREQLWGAEHPQVASSLHHLAVLERANGHYDQAEPLFQRALAMREHLLGPDHLETAASLHGLASLYESRRLFDKGEALARRALDIYERQVGADDLETTPVRHTLVNLFLHQGRFEEAERLCQRNLAIRERHLGPDHLLTARSLNMLGMLYYFQGRFEEAERLYKRVIAIFEQHLGPAHFQTAIMLHNLAELYTDQGRYQEAEPLCEQVLALYEQHLGPNHAHTADCLIGLAAVSLRLGKHAQAEVLARRALELHEAHLGPLHPYVVDDLAILGASSREQGRYAEAESLFQRAMQIHAQSPTMPVVLQSALYELARLRETQGWDEQAVDFYQQALEAGRQTGRITHPLMRAIRQHLATLLVRLGRSEETAQLEASLPASSTSAGPQV